MGYFILNSPDDTQYLTLDEALEAWCLGWTVMQQEMDSSESIINLYSDSGVMVDSWNTREAFFATEKNLAELEEYLDPAEIGCIAVSGNGFSVDQQIFDALMNVKHETFLDIISKFPEITDVQWSGSWVDWEAMGVDQEWSMWLLEEIEQSSDIQWIDGEPYIIGIRTLEYGDN